MNGKTIVLGLAAATMFTVILAVNLRPFFRAGQDIRTKDLSFLPDPELMKVLAIGHNNSVQRLRWIDSFAYLQLQMDRRDDHVAGGGSGFTKLYNGLFALDPHFIPVFQQAATCVGGIVGRPQDALSFLMLGIQENPTNFSLWQNAAAILANDFKMEENCPGGFDEFLSSWADNMPEEAYRNSVWQWKSSLARRKFKDLNRLDYWLVRLKGTPKGDVLYRYIEDIIRDQIAGYGERVLNDIASERRAAGLPVLSVADLADAERLNARGVNAQYGPVAADDAGNPIVRSDPWGRPYVLTDDGTVESFGKRLSRVQQQIDRGNGWMTNATKEKGRWPDTLQEALEWATLGDYLEYLPKEIVLNYSDRKISVTIGDPPSPPWTIP